MGVYCSVILLCVCVCECVGAYMYVYVSVCGCVYCSVILLCVCECGILLSVLQTAQRTVDITTEVEENSSTAGNSHWCYTLLGR